MASLASVLFDKMRVIFFLSLPKILGLLKTWDIFFPHSPVFLFTHVGYCLFFLSLDSPTYYSTFLTKLMAASFFIAIPFLHFHGPPIGGGRCHVAHDGRQARKLARSRSVALFNPILFSGWASYHGVFGFVYYIKCLVLLVCILPTLFQVC